jgi:hypothetical protein
VAGFPLPKSNVIAGRHLSPPLLEQKSCSLADVANEIPRFNAKLANKFTVEDVKAVYEDVIYEANEEDREVPEEEHGDAGMLALWLLLL